MEKIVRDIDISLINEAPYNPRVKLEPGMPEWEKLNNSLSDFGNLVPLVWNEQTGNLVGGHQRLSILRGRGETQIPCSVVHLSEYDEKLLNIALNKIKGQFDYDKLRDLMNELDYEIREKSGFAAEEIALILQSNEDLYDDEDYLDDFPEDEPEEIIVGGSYVVTLVFASNELAAMWADANGYESRVKEGTYTTVIRVEEA